MKVIKITKDEIIFEDGTKLFSSHEQHCCEVHELGIEDLSMQDFEGLEFDLSSDVFFERIEGYGIALSPINGYPVRIAAHNYNNGYYSDELTLNIEYPSGEIQKWDITECQEKDWK